MTACPPLSALIGRAAEFDRLGRLLRDVAGGVGGSVWIEGEPGIGKSALLEASLADAARLGCEVRSADADEFGRRVPLQVMLECLGAEPGSSEPELREIAESLSRGAGREAPGDPVAAASERLLGLVDGLTRRGPLVLAIDDLQWADEASVLLLHRLSRLAHRRPLLLVVACRPVPRRADLVTLRRGLTASGPITLSALTPAAVTRLASSLTMQLTGARTAGPRLRRSIEQAGGNPLYLRELIGAAARENLLRRDEDTVELAGDRTGLPRGLTEAIAERLGFLSAGTVEVLRSAALLGSAFSVTDLGAVVGRSAVELTSALEEATAAGVLTESSLSLRFRHTLIRQALYETPAAGLRLALHLQAARSLADAGMAVERVAEQLLSALRAPDAVTAIDGWTVDWLLRAGQALVCRAPCDAVELLGLTAGHLRPDDPRREPLEAILAPALVLLGRRAEALRLTERVLSGTRDPARTAEMSWTAGWAMTDDQDVPGALRVLGRALRTRGLDRTWTARLHAMLARAALAGGDLPRADAAVRLALTDADRAGDLAATSAALNVEGVLLVRRGDLEGAMTLFERALSIASLCEDPELRLRSRLHRAYVLLLQERQAETDAAVGELLEFAGRDAAPAGLACARILSAEVHFHAGRWDEAVGELEAAVGAADLVPVRDRQWLHGLAALIAVHRDDQAAAEAHLDAVPGAPSVPGVPYVAVARALLAERRDLTDEALGILTGLLEREGRYPAYHRHIWLPTLVRLALGAGDHALARTTAEAGTYAPALDGRRRLGLRLATRGTAQTAVAQHCAGLLDADPSRLDTAVDAYRAAGRPLQLAQTLEDAAVVLAHEGDLRAARTAHAEASELYADLGAGWDLLRVDTRLRRYGVRRRRGPRRRAVTGWEALTPAELTVARLLADGRPNPDIAANLFVSRRTVEVHVSHILAKLGVRSRVEIAREANLRFGTEAPVPTPSARAG